MSALDDIASTIRSRQATLQTLGRELGEALGRHSRAASALAAVEAECREVLSAFREAQFTKECALADRKRLIRDFFDAHQAGEDVQLAASRIEEAELRFAEAHAKTQAAYGPEAKDVVRRIDLAREALRDVKQAADRIEEIVRVEKLNLDLDMQAFYGEWRSSK